MISAVKNASGRVILRFALNVMYEFNQIVPGLSQICKEEKKNEPIVQSTF